ncbi:hypothetical protein HN51_029317 [Arachis hypogaea]|uniref:Uncharacterized protein LOC107467347 isoform X1 n=2 Tax=Arachis TaxID=3817 RepID=A0A6P5MUK9_ARADU|nr:uncharacterized protein LOC107467347 isoform X1 [Arachis duranensis]XP_020986951.1 uncharacterized protein LOC107467347 isoform X1 [Arachis duranensis]XP_025620449.1 uncharacterized protein LOC112711924 isoform X1 [Arachis hypogaea]XP_057736327.1 uncharacterized protein LOC130951651 isoform X1 [Arachis stenosperma]QHO35920.1 uncharacterized protein DS421_9g279420 [Arachis hypogaea]RYR37302.1 hypothetical protein Ahy_A09g042212 [Arachis hypogaea]
MARRGVTDMLLLRTNRGARRTESGVIKFSGSSQHAAESCGGIPKSYGKIEDSTCWVPHPRTGIYFPKGHEWVMDDVPEGAASFTQTYWLRNVDGVDNTKA